MGTNVNDILVPELLAESIQGKLAGVLGLYGTGAVAVDTKLRAEKQDVGTDIKVPYFGTLGEAEEIPAGGALRPRKLSQEYETATIRHTGIAFSTSDLARIAAADDPHAEAARQAMESITRRFDTALITAATSDAIPATNSTPAGTWPLILDKYTGTPEKFSQDTAIAARLLFGDEQMDEDMGMFLIHSKTLGDLYAQKDSTGRLLLTDPIEGKLRKLMGIPVGISDRSPSDLTLSPPKYTTALLKKNSLALWVKAMPEVYTGTDILAADQVMAIHVYFVVHRYRRVQGRSKPGVVVVKHK